MNCETIDAILDEHRTALLDPAERQEVSKHVAGCRRCAEVWFADDTLRADAVGDPPPELLATVLRSVTTGSPAPAGARRLPWAAPTAAVAALALVAIVARVATAPVAGSDEGEVANTGAVAESPFVAGRHYEVLRGAAAMPATSGGVPVIEFFMYGCPPCSVLESELERWAAQRAGGVSLTRVPALFHAEAELHARAFYTAEALGKLDEMHAAFYAAIHTRGNRLASRAALAEFFTTFGVDAATFDATFDSSEVDARMREAAALNREYAIRATPSLVVAGRYSTNPSLAGLDVLAVVDRLVAEERTNSCPARRAVDC